MLPFHLAPIPCRPSLIKLGAPVLAAGLLVLGGCARVDSRNPAVRPMGAASVELQTVLDVMLRPATQTAAADLLASLPRPAETTVVKVTNPHNPRVRDELVTLAFDGLAVRVYHVAETAQRFPVEVDVTGAGHATDAGLRVGLSASATRDLLGDPTQIRGDRWFYEVMDDPAAAPYELVLDLRGGTIQRMSWRAYLD